MPTPEKDRPVLVERTVAGNKSYGWFDHDYEGNDPAAGRKFAQPGDKILVKPTEAIAFPHRLVDPVVADAQKAAEDAVAAANQAVKDSEAQAKAVTPAPEVIEEPEGISLNIDSDDPDDGSDASDDGMEDEAPAVELKTMDEVKEMSFAGKKAYAGQFNIIANSHEGFIRELNEAGKIADDPE